MILRVKILSIICCFCGLQAFAQTEAGSFMLGGNISFSTLAEDERKDFSVSPTLGYFLFNNFALELKPSLSISFYQSGLVERGRGLALAVGARYYITIDDARFRPLLLVEHNWGRGKITYREESNTFGKHSPNRSNTFSAGVGGAYFLTPNFALEGLLTYQRIDFEFKDTKIPIDVDIFEYFSLNIGAKFFFPLQSKK